MTGFSTNSSNSSEILNTTICNTTIVDTTIIVILRTSFIILTMLAILFGNIINIIILNSTPLWHRSTTLLLKNLSITDCCIGLCFTLLAIYPSGASLCDWPYGKLLCAMTSFIGGTCGGVSVITLALISIDRYFIVLQPLDHQDYLSITKVWILIIGSWIIPASLHVLQIIIGGNEFYFYNQPAFMCTAHYSQFNIFISMSFFLLYALTNIVIFCVYFRIIPVSLRHSKLIRKYKTTTSTESMRKEKSHLLSDKSNKSICTLVVITIVFNLCWAPTAISVIVEKMSETQPSNWQEFFFAWLSMCNSFMNTIVYMAMNQKYRKAVRKLFARGQMAVYTLERRLSTPCHSSVLSTGV